MATIDAQATPSTGIPNNTQITLIVYQYVITGSLFFSILNLPINRIIPIGYSNQSFINSTALYSFITGIPSSTILKFLALVNIPMGTYVLYLTPLSRLFGSSAVQNINSITFKKSDLPGLTPQINNTAESIFIGLLLRTMYFDSNSEMSTIYTYLSKAYFSNTGNTKFINHTIVIDLFKRLDQVGYVYYDPVFLKDPDLY